jgi:hypothetical protein
VVTLSLKIPKYGIFRPPEEFPTEAPSAVALPELDLNRLELQLTAKAVH